MLHQLPPTHFDRVRRLTDARPHFLSAQAVVSGDSPGWLWVDDVDQPTAAFICAPEGWHLLTDQCDPGLGADVADLYRERLAIGRAEGWRYSCLFWDPAGWEELLVPRLAELDPQVSAQHYLCLTHRRDGAPPTLPRGVELRRVDAELLASGMEGADDIDGWGFGGREGLLARGFSFVAIAEGAIVCACTADCVVGEHAEIGIHTHEAWRRRGLATATAAAAVDHCLASGITRIGWHCWTRNEASLATARRVGFEWVREHRGAEFVLQA